jgi:hypothetical protein
MGVVVVIKICVKYPTDELEQTPLIYTVLRGVYDIYESSYRVMDNLGGGEQRATD